MRAHASQIPETSFFLSMPDEIFSMVWGREWFIRVRPGARAPGQRETDLMVEMEETGTSTTTAENAARAIRAPDGATSS